MSFIEKPMNSYIKTRFFCQGQPPFTPDRPRAAQGETTQGKRRPEGQRGQTMISVESQY